MSWRIPVGLAAFLAACGGGDDGLEVASGWYRAVTAGETAAACRVMEPTAVQALREKYTQLPTGATCEQVVADYAAKVDASKAQAILDGGFEEGNPTPTGELGVFPAAPSYEFEIVLVKEVEGEWRVISVNLSPA